MKKLIRLGILLFVFGLLTAVGIYLYVFHKPHRNIMREKPAYIVEAKLLYSEFTLDESASYEKYGNQVLQVTGTVVDQTKKENGSAIIYLEEIMGINCYFDSLSVVSDQEKMNQISVGGKITLKGQCDGYDMIMGVVLTRCVLLDVNTDLALLKD